VVTESRWKSSARQYIAAAAALALAACSSTTTSDSPVAVASLDVNPSTVSVVVGQSATISAVPKSASGNSMTARPVQWSSSAPSVASVSGSGLVTGLAAGTATLTATSGGASKQVSVTVLPQTFVLSVSGAGNGDGTVTSTPAGISCSIVGGRAGAGCSANYTAGTSVTLAASASSGNAFGGWAGACTGTASCVIPVTSSRSVTATFSRAVAPVVTTDSADTINANSGRILGTVVQDGSPYTVWFEYGSSPTLATFSQTGIGSGPGTACQGAPACTWITTLNSLTPGTTYYFRLVASNAVGTTKGNIRSFVTSPSVAPVISNLSVRLVSLNTCSNGGSSFELTFSFTDASGDVSFSGTPVTVGFNFQPSAVAGSFAAQVSASTGTGASGTISVQPCDRFGSDASVTHSVTLTNAAGKVSNTLSAIVTKPAGAASVGPGNSGSGGAALELIVTPEERHPTASALTALRAPKR